MYYVWLKNMTIYIISATFFVSWRAAQGFSSGFEKLNPFVSLLVFMWPWVQSSGASVPRGQSSVPKNTKCWYTWPCGERPFPRRLWTWTQILPHTGLGSVPDISITINSDKRCICRFLTRTRTRRDDYQFRKCKVDSFWPCGEGSRRAICAREQTRFAFFCSISSS